MKTRDIVIFAIAVIGAVAQLAGQNPPAAPAKKAPAGPGLTLTTNAFEDGGVIPNKYTQQDPKPVSPKLSWTNVPAGTVSFALILHDPDTAPMRSSEDILHWMIFN